MALCRVALKAKQAAAALRRELAQFLDRRLLRAEVSKVVPFQLCEVTALLVPVADVRRRAELWETSVLYSERGKIGSQCRLRETRLPAQGKLPDIYNLGDAGLSQQGRQLIRGPALVAGCQ